MKPEVTERSERECICIRTVRTGPNGPLIRISSTERGERLKGRIWGTRCKGGEGRSKIEGNGDNWDSCGRLEKEIGKLVGPPSSLVSNCEQVPQLSEEVKSTESLFTV